MSKTLDPELRLLRLQVRTSHSCSRTASHMSTSVQTDTDAATGTNARGEKHPHPVKPNASLRGVSCGEKTQVLGGGVSLLPSL